MPWELIYTSAPRGLISGQSGFCTVARTRDLRESLAQRLEQISSYHYLEYAGTNAPQRNPIISAYRLMDLRGTKFHVLSRILPCGFDFTARTNHLAHHLVFGADELADLPSPATIFLHWSGWQTIWRGEPRLLDPLPAGSFKRLPSPAWPAATWQQLTGDAGRAAGLLENDLIRGCYIVTPSGGEQTLLNLYCETLHLLNPAGRTSQRAWQHTFTTFLQGEDTATDFQWRGCQAGTTTYEQAVNRLATPISPKAVRIPNNDLARLAREGPKISPAASAQRPQAPLSVRKPPARMPLEDLRNVAPKRVNRDFSGYDLSISHKSLIGMAIAIILLLGLLEAKKHLWAGKSRLDAQPPVVARASQPDASTPVPQGPKNQSPPAPGPVPAVSPPVEPRREVVEADDKLEAELAGKLPNMPTYLFVAPTLPNDDIPLAGPPALVDILQHFYHYQYLPADLSLNFKLNSWGSPAKSPAIVESVPNNRMLIVRGSEEQKEDQFVFDYSGFPEKTTGEETVHLQAHFDQQQLSAVTSLSLVFGPNGRSNATHNAKFQRFGLLVINGSNQPPWLELSKHFLQLDSGTPDGAYREPLRKKLKHLHKQGFVWQLRPYMNVTNSSGTQAVVDLYDQFPEWARPGRGTELEFAREIQLLKNRHDESLAESDQIQKKIDGINAIVQPGVDWGLPVGTMLGLTNGDLVSFNTFVAAVAGRNPSAPLFLEYLRLMADTARPQQTWLENWPAYPDWGNPAWEANHFDLVLKSLQQFYDLWAANSPQSVAALAVGTAANNYFVEGWQNLSRTGAIAIYTQQKKIADDNVQQLENLLNSMPATLDQVAEVRLYLVDSGYHLEVIRFTNSGGRRAP